ncbi:MAG: hypothetical protein ACLGIC_05320 [Acidimicrobiia bacterium]
MTMLEERTSHVPPTEIDRPIPVTRRRVDHLLIGLGVVAMVVMVLAGGLLTWGSNFSEDYVSDELTAQNISFPPTEALVEEGRDDLAEFGGQQVDTGDEAEAYASFIQGHIENTAGGLTYSEIDDRGARAAVEEAIASGASEAEVAELQETADTLTRQRDTVFKGEMLRGTLLNAYAWSTMGRIAGIAATVAFAGAAVMALLSVAGVLHLRKVTHH